MRSPFSPWLTSKEVISGATNGTGTTQSLPAEDNYEETADYFYFGWASQNGGWLIRRQTRSDSALQGATANTNSSYSDLSAAWTARASLNYS